VIGPEHDVGSGDHGRLWETEEEEKEGTRRTEKRGMRRTARAGLRTGVVEDWQALYMKRVKSKRTEKGRFGKTEIIIPEQNRKSSCRIVCWVSPMDRGSYHWGRGRAII